MVRRQCAGNVAVRPSHRQWSATSSPRIANGTSFDPELSDRPLYGDFPDGNRTDDSVVRLPKCLPRLQCQFGIIVQGPKQHSGVETQPHSGTVGADNSTMNSSGISSKSSETSFDQTSSEFGGGPMRRRARSLRQSIDNGAGWLISHIEAFVSSGTSFSTSLPVVSNAEFLSHIHDEIRFLVPSSRIWMTGTGGRGCRKTPPARGDQNRSCPAKSPNCRV